MLSISADASLHLAELKISDWQTVWPIRLFVDVLVIAVLFLLANVLADASNIQRALLSEQRADERFPLTS